MKILAINAGSSSIKSSLFDLSDSQKLDADPPIWEASVDVKHHKLEIDIGNDTFDRSLSDDDKANPFNAMLNALWQGDGAVLSGPKDVQAIGHRIVHGGPKYHESIVIDQTVKNGIRDLFEFAPLHNPANLRGIQWAEKIFGSSVPQVAVFDTGFHHSLPPEASTYALPFELCRRYQIRRYGFHGISHQYCSSRAARVLGRDLANFKVIVCHLGNGCSLSAVRDGTSIDTTMGFTPLDGLVMGTRSGAIDPGILIYLVGKEAPSHDQLDELLDKRSGLLGISGTTSDMREILEARGKGDKRAALAFDVFVHSLTGYIGAMLTRLNGADALVFTGGIGERASAVRAAACQSLSFAGIELNESKNSSCHDDADISADNAKVRTLVVHTRENWAIAKDAQRLI